MLHPPGSHKSQSVTVLGGGLSAVSQLSLLLVAATLRLSRGVPLPNLLQGGWPWTALDGVFSRSLLACIATHTIAALRFVVPLSAAAANVSPFSSRFGALHGERAARGEVPFAEFSQVTMAAARAMEPGCMSRSVHCAGSTVANGSGRQPWSSANSLSLRESPLCQSLVRNRRSHGCRVVSVATKEGDAETESSQMITSKKPSGTRGYRGNLFLDGVEGRVNVVKYMDRSIDLDAILESLRECSSEEEMKSVMAQWKGKLSQRLMMSLLKLERDWQRSLALHDWMLEEGGYAPSTFGYNIVIRNVLKARKWTLGEGLVSEMMEKRVVPDKYTYSSLISSFGKAGKFDSAVMWLQRMEEKGVRPDLVIYSTVIELAGKLKNFPKAVALFVKMKEAGVVPDRVVYNSMINLFGKAKLYKEAESILVEMNELGLEPDTVTYTALMNAYAENKMYTEARGVFLDMRVKGCPPDLCTYNIMINVYGKLGLIKEAEHLFWKMKDTTTVPSVVTFNTLINVYAEAHMAEGAIRIYRLMHSKGYLPNIVTYNTILKMWCNGYDLEKVSNVLQQMQRRGIPPNATTYSQLIAFYCKIGKYDRAATLFQSLRVQGFPMDWVLYHSMVVAYEKGGLLGHARRLLEELKIPGHVSRDTAINVMALAGKVDEASKLFWRAENAGEIKDISVYQNMIKAFMGDMKMPSSAGKVYNVMKQRGLLPDSDTALLILKAHGQMESSDQAESVYRELQEAGLVFREDVHCKMLELYGHFRELESAKALFTKLREERMVSEKTLHLAMARVYENNNRLDEASKIIQGLKMSES